MKNLGKRKAQSVKRKVKTQSLKFLVLNFSFVLCALSFALDCFAAENFFEIKARKFSYTPNIIKVAKGDIVNIRLISEDVHHGFFLDGYGIKTSAHPGQDGSLKFTADKTGRFSFRCSVTCGEFHPYMVGYLIVGPNARFYFFIFLTLLVGFVNLLFVVINRDKENVQG